MPRDPDSRMAVWRNLLTDFVWSLGRGETERATRRGPGAGVGAAITGPWELEDLRIKQRQADQLAEYRMAMEENKRIASEELMQKINENQLRMPYEFAQLAATLGLTQARTGQTQAQTAATQAGIPLTEARTDLTQAQTTTEGERPALVQAQTAQATHAANAPYPTQNIDPWGEEAVKRKIELAKATPGRGSMYERLGHDEYMRMTRDAALARQNIDPDSINQYVQGILNGTVSNLSQVPLTIRGDVLAGLGSVNGMIISPAERDGIRKLDTALYLVDQLESYSKKVSDDPSDIQSELVLNGLRKAVSGIFAKGVFAEAGVLTEGDVRRVQSIVPGITISILAPDISKALFTELRGIVNKAKSNYRRPIGQISGQAATPAAPAAPAVTPQPGVQFIQQGGRLVPVPQQQGPQPQGR